MDFGSKRLFQFGSQFFLPVLVFCELPEQVCQSCARRIWLKISLRLTLQGEYYERTCAGKHQIPNFHVGLFVGQWKGSCLWLRGKDFRKQIFPS